MNRPRGRAGFWVNLKLQTSNIIMMYDYDVQQSIDRSACGTDLSVLSLQSHYSVVPAYKSYRQNLRGADSKEKKPNNNTCA